jgi:hypothetical protein
MTRPALILFDDRIGRDWMPFTLTRPAGELMFGAFTLRERAERVLRLSCLGHLVADHLADFDEHDAPGGLRLADLPRDRGLVFLSSRAALEWQSPPAFEADPALLAIGDDICGWYAPAGSEFPPPGFLDDPGGNVPAGIPVLPLDGTLIDRPWRLITRNADRVARDILALGTAPHGMETPAGVHRLGDAPLVLGADVVVEPGVVLDLREGPIWIDDGAHIRAFTRVAGPAYIGRGSTLLGGPFSSVSIGPVCKVHGEIEESIVLGYSNKAHDGFLGHAYVGRWVNLGALTTNSDLKNNYGSIRMWTPAGEVDTGERKLGCLLGDHVKTAIGTLLNTGTVVGAGANLFGPGAPSKYVPPFSWGTGDAAKEYALEKFIETAETVMARRNVALSARHRAHLEAAWRLGRSRL